MNAMFDTCMLCGRRTRKPGEALCVPHDFQALIEPGYQRMIERVRGGKMFANVYISSRARQIRPGASKRGS